MKWLGLETNERKNLALWMLFGGAIVFTAYATAGLWLTASEPTYVFWLAIAAHIQIFTIMTGYVAQLVKRRLHVGRDGIDITDAVDTKYEEYTDSSDSNDDVSRMH